MEMVTTVFHQYEVGMREACIESKDLHTAMMILGVNIMEQECIDMTNEVAKNGHIYFPEFCRIVLRKFREDDDEQFAQVMFKMLCGTEPFPELYRAKKYKINQKFLSKEDFHYIMHNLPVAVADEDIADMFAVADSDSDGRISYKEFQKMINPPKPPEGPKPTKQDFVKRFSQASPVCTEMEPLLQESPVMVTISGPTGESSVGATAGGLSPCTSDEGFLTVR